MKQRLYLGVLYLFGPMVFFPASLFMGQNAIDIRPGSLGSLNIRYGTTIAPLVAVGCGLLVAGLAGYISFARLKLTTLAAVVVAIVLVGSQVQQWQNPAQAGVLRDVAAQPSLGLDEYADWLEANYDYGRIMAESFGTLNSVQLRSGIDLSQYITENNGDMWSQALQNPTTIVEWVLIRKGDLLDQELRGQPAFLEHFDLVFENAYGYIYRTVDHESRAQAEEQG